MPKPVIPRTAATRDAEQAIQHYLEEGAWKAASDFVSALEEAFTHIGAHPESGSPRMGHELELPGLRAWPLSRYPYLVFYVEREDHVDVWRVLHVRRDVPQLQWGEPPA